MSSEFDFKENEFLFQDVFFYSIVGQILVDEHLNIVFANNRMFEYFRSKPYDTTGLPFGRAFFCRELRNNSSGCGKGKNCFNCGILNAMEEIRRNNIPIENYVSQYCFHWNNHYRKKWFQLNGNPITYCNRRFFALSFADVTELKQREIQLRKRLSLDLPTKTMNKFSLMKAVQNLLESNGGSCRFTIALIDFDNFKEINSRYGHITGDEILKVFADISRRYIRKSDLLGRFGGEEFVFVFNETDERQATQILKRIHEALESYYSEALDMPITFSSGILYVDNVSYALSSCSKLIDDVDRLMYQAKNDGRGRAVSSMGKMLFAKGS